jgi:hypothetical protein
MEEPVERGSFFLSRRSFLAGAARALACGTAVSAAGCLFALNPETPRPASSDALGRIDDNHDHEAVITKAQLDAGGGLTLDITGKSTHPHTVVLSAADMADIRAGKHVRVRSTVDWGHDHGVHFNLA